MADDNKYDNLRQECWDKAHDTFGYSYIFNKRSSKFKKRVTWLTTFGILVPVAIGAIAISYKYKPAFVDTVILLATPFTIIQFLLSIFSIIWSWDAELSYSIDASRAHATLYERFRKLAKNPPPKLEELAHSYEVLDVEYIERTKQDVQHNVKDWEQRLAMRAGLRELQRKCVDCKILPRSLENSKCNVCGNYSLKYKILNK